MAESFLGFITRVGNLGVVKPKNVKKLKVEKQQLESPEKGSNSFTKPITG